MNKKRLNISVVFLGPFPIGNVSTVRIISYCKAFVKKGHFVKVFIIAPTDEAKQNKLKCGVVDGVHFQYVSRITWRGEKTNFIVKSELLYMGIYVIIALIGGGKYSIDYLLRNQYAKICSSYCKPKAENTK